MIVVVLAAADVNNLLSVPWWLYLMAVVIGGLGAYERTDT